MSGKITGILILCLLTISSAGNVIRFGIPQDYINEFSQAKGLVGTFLVAEHIFTNAGYTVKVVRRPGQRMNLSLRHNEIDFYLNTSRIDAFPHDNTVQSYLPMTVMPILIYYRASQWQPQWPPDDNFLAKIGKSVSSPLYYRERFNLQISQSPNFEAAIKMVELGRADYYLGLLSEFSHFYGPKATPVSPEFIIKTIRCQPIYGLFRDTEIGKVLKNIFDSGQLSLLKNQRYKKIYLQRPLFPQSSRLVDTLIATIKKQHPELGLKSTGKGFASCLGD